VTPSSHGWITLGSSSRWGSGKQNFTVGLFRSGLSPW